MIADQKQRIQDDAERRACLDVTRSFVVQAPAGSGKTELLVRRFVKLIASTRNPEEVLAITFTKKAAAEMRRRVLEKVANPAEVAHRLRIETIDAFSLSLARQLPLPAQFGVPPGILEDATELFREAAKNTLALLEQSQYAKPVGRLLEHLDNDMESAARLLASMLAKRDQWMRKALVSLKREELEAALAAERERLLLRARKLDARASEEFADAVLTKNDGTWRKNAPHPEIVDNEPLREALHALRSMPPARYEEDQWEALAAIVEVLPIAAAELKLVFARHGLADFTEITQGAVRALGSVEDPSELLLKLDQRISHILVDEFQDTSISQWELLDKLTAGWSPGDGRTLFVVGDPMQSIYLFREAVVGLFLRARREGLPNVRLEPVSLKTNFRSQAGLVEFYNGVFPRVFPLSEDETSGAVPYSACAPNDPALPGPAASWHCFPDADEEAGKVVGLVKEAQAHGTTALLVRNRTALIKIVPALKESGIRFRAIEIDALGEKQVVQDLFALTRALTHLGDRVAWLAILRAPWSGMTLEELLNVVPAEAGTHTVWDQLQKRSDRAHLIAVLKTALDNRLRGTLRDRVESVWLALGGPACLADPTDLDDADAYLDALEDLEEAGEVDFARLADSLDRLFAQPDANAGERDLQIMTIHKAKGLEFDTVIVPGLDRGPGRSDSPLLRWRELPDQTLLFAPIKETGTGEEPAYKYLGKLDREAEDTEASRLLYVAATRAIKRLHLMACLKVDDHGDVRAPAKRSLLGRAWPAAEGEFPDTLPVSVAQASSHSLPPQTLRRLPQGFKVPQPPAAAKWTAPPEGREEEQIEFSWAGETARHVGTVVHQWLQRIAEDELKGWDAKRVEALRPRFEIELRRRGTGKPETAAAQVVTALKRALEDERGRWLLGAHPRALNEHRLRSPGRSFRIDRYIEDAKGGKWVVDYKTSEHKGGGVEAFLDEQRERYAAQLDAYAEAVGGARRGLYFPLLKSWREWGA